MLSLFNGSMKDILNRTSIQRMLMVGALALGSSLLAEPMVPAERLQAMAREAKTVKQHAEVAKHSRLQAESLAAEAVKHEREAEKLSNSMGAMRHKWPAMAPKAIHQAKQAALEARRAARESYELADLHQRLAVEALATD